MTSTFTAKADEATATLFDTVTKVQDATLEAVSTFTANLPEAPKVPAFEIPGIEVPKFDLPKVELPSATEVATAFYDIVEKLVESSKSFTANLPEAPKVPTFEIPGVEVPKFDLPEVDLPTTDEVTAAFYNFVDQFVANSKSFTERFIAAATPASN
jgi:hypothetical protein